MMNNQLNKMTHILLSPVTAYMFVGTVLLFIIYKVEIMAERLSHHHCPPHGSSFVAQKWFDKCVWVTIAFPVTFPILATKAALALAYHIAKIIIHHLYIHLWEPFKVAYLSLGSMLLFQTYKVEKIAERCAGHHLQGKTSFHAKEWHNRGIWWTVQFPIVWPIVTTRAALILAYYSIQDLLYYLGELIDITWEYCKRLLKHFWNLINSAWLWLCDTLRYLVEYIKKVIRWIVAYVRNVVQWIVELVRPLYDQILRYFVKIWAPIVELIKKVWRWISHYVVKAWRLVVKVVTAIWNRISYYTRIIWLRVVSLVKGIWEWISHYLSKAWRLVLRIFKTVWDWISLYLGIIWDRILILAKATWNLIAEYMQKIWLRIVVLIETIWQWSVKLVKSVWRWVSHYVVKAWRLVVKVVTAIWNRISYYTRIIWLRVVSLVKGIWKWISHYLSKAWRLVLRIFIAVWRWTVLTTILIWIRTTETIKLTWLRCEMTLTLVFNFAKELLKAILKHIKATVLSTADTAKKGLYLIVKTVKKISWSKDVFS